MPKNEELRKLMETAAAALVGESVLVRFIEPIVEEFVGNAYLAPNGVKAIDIKPGLDEDTTLAIFLHEVAHHHFGHTLLFLPISKRLGELHEQQGHLYALNWSEEEQEEYEKKTEELEAESFSIYFFIHAKNEAERRFGTSSLENCLRVLIETHIQDRSQL